VLARIIYLSTWKRAIIDIKAALSLKSHTLQQKILTYDEKQSILEPSCKNDNVIKIVIFHTTLISARYAIYLRADDQVNTINKQPTLNPRRRHVEQ
jgi:hypothetical protein